LSIKSKHMTDKEFVEFCYLKILRRSPDKEDKIHYSNALSSRHLTREDMMIQFVTCEEFESRVASQEFVPSGHFYSAIHSIEEIEAFLSSNPPNDDEILGVNLNTQKQIDLLKQFKKYHDQCPFPDHKTEQFRYYFSNPSYSYTDSLTLYSMIREFKPKKIIDVSNLL